MMLETPRTHEFLKLNSYTPGSWIEKVGSMKLSDYDVPTTTSLILVGPKGSGKSSLVNRISKVFEDDKFASERSQVSRMYDISTPSLNYGYESCSYHNIS